MNLAAVAFDARWTPWMVLSAAEKTALDHDLAALTLDVALCSHRLEALRVSQLPLIVIKWHLYLPALERHHILSQGPFTYIYTHVKSAPVS